MSRLESAPKLELPPSSALWTSPPRGRGTPTISTARQPVDSSPAGLLWNERYVGIDGVLRPFR